MLKRAVSFDELKTKVHNAMVRARFLVPAMAYTVSLLPTNEYQFTYVIPQSPEDALKWADAVSFFYGDAKSFKDAHDKIGETRWWRAREGRYTHEVHVHPNSKSALSWTVTLVLHSLFLKQDHMLYSPV